MKLHKTRCRGCSIYLKDDKLIKEQHKERLTSSRDRHRLRRLRTRKEAKILGGRQKGRCSTFRGGSVDEKATV
jgi:hypothetical protein